LRRLRDEVRINRKDNFNGSCKDKKSLTNLVSEGSKIKKKFGFDFKEVH
jgi:hypothetical protein